MLETFLHHQVVIELGLEDRSNVLATPWILVVETADRIQTVLSEGIWVELSVLISTIELNYRSTGHLPDFFC